jgi:hypothetical protein
LWPAILRAHAERESHQYELGQLVVALVIQKH